MKKNKMYFKREKDREGEETAFTSITPRGGRRSGRSTRTGKKRGKKERKGREKERAREKKSVRGRSY